MRRSRDQRSRSRKITIHMPLGARRPGDGFYLYVNGQWLQKTHIMNANSEYSLSKQVEDKTDHTLFKEIQGLPNAQTTTPKTDKDRLSLFYKIWSEKKPDKEEDYIRLCLSELMESRGPQDIARFFGWLCRSCIPTLLNIGSQRERQPPYFNRVILTTGGLLLPPVYYLNAKIRKSSLWLAYIQFISICAIELGLPFLTRAVQAEVELAILINRSPKNVDLNIAKSGKSLKHWLPEFEWQGFMEGLQLDSQWESRIWLIDNPHLTKRILQWVSRADTETLVALWSLHLIRSAASQLRKPIQDASYKLFNVELMGIKKRSSDQDKFMSLIKSVLPGPLCTVYSNHQDPHIIKAVHSLTENLKKSAISIMSQTTIMSKKAHRSILEKLHRMKFKLGKGPSNPSLDVRYDPESLLHTSFNLLSSSIHLMMKNTSRPSNPENGQYPCFIFNASYHPEINQIVLPWGILQEPFYSENRPLGWNYGGLGATISHEITHAFDLQGSKYSERAVYKNTWTRRNRSRFKTETRKVSRFFSNFKHYGKPLDGKKTVSEDWADLGGMKISLNALQAELDDLGSSEKERKEAYRNFFLAYASSWRKVVRKKYLLLSIEMDVHSPAEDRVDRIVPQFQEWVDAFDVKESDRLYIAEKDRLKFF